MITKFYKKKLVFFLIVSILFTNFIFSCNRNIHSKKNNYVGVVPTNNINYDDSITYRTELKNILHQINYLKNAMNQNNYILEYYKKVFSSNINYVWKQACRIKNKINIANSSIVNELNSIYNVKKIIISHPYNYSFFLKKDNYCLPYIHQNNSKKVKSKLVNIEIFTNCINKPKININNISYQSEESFVGIKSMTSILSCTKSLVFDKINVNYDDIYYFSKYHNNLIPINNYIATPSKNIVSTNQFINKSNTNIKVGWISQQTSLFNKNSIGNYITNKPYVAILPFLFGIGVIIIILGGTKNGNRIIRKKIEKKLRVLIRKGTSLKETDEYISQMKSTISKQPNIDSIEMKELKSAELTPDSMEVTEGNLLDTECISGLMEKMPSYLEEPRTIGNPDIFLETAMDYDDFLKSSHSTKEYKSQPMASKSYIKTDKILDQSSDTSIDVAASEKKFDLVEKLEHNAKQLKRYVELSKPQELFKPLELSMTQIVLQPIPRKATRQKGMIKKDLAFQDYIIKVLELQALEHNVSNLSADKWVLLDDTMMSKIAKNELFFKNLYHAENDYYGVKKRYFIQQILNYLFQKRLSLLDTETTFNKINWLLNIKNIIDEWNNKNQSNWPNINVRDIFWNIFSDFSGSELPKYSGNSFLTLTTNGWFAKPNRKFLLGMRNPITTKQEYKFMIDQREQLKEIQNYIPELHSHTEYYIALMNELSQQEPGVFQIQNISRADRFSINSLLCDINELLEMYIKFVNTSQISVDKLSDCPDIKVQLPNFVNRFKDSRILMENPYNLKRFSLSEQKVFEQLKEVV